MTDEAGELYRRRQALPASEGPVESTGFLENMQAGFSTFFDEETTVGEYLNRGVYEERNRDLDTLIASGDIKTDGYWDGDEIDYSRLAFDLKRSGKNAMDDYDVRNNLREELAVRRQYSQDIFERANAGGVAGQFIGQTSAAMVDPVNIAAMFVPGLAAIRTGTAIARAGKAALWYGGTAAASETAIQVGSVKDWKKHLGVEYTTGDALTAIAFASIGSAAIGVPAEFGADAIRKGFKKTRARIRELAPDNEKPSLYKELDRAERQYNWHVQLYRRDQILQRVERLKEARKQLSAQAKQRKVDAAIDEYNKVEFQKWLDEADMLPIESMNDIYDDMDAQFALFFPDQSSNDPVHLGLVDDPKFDTETRSVIDRIETEDRLELNENIKPRDPPDTFPDDAPKPEEPTGNPFDDFDEDQFMRMTQEQRDAYLSEVLGEESLDDLAVYEEVGVDVNGDPMYTQKSRGEIDAEIDETLEQIDNFVDCWKGTD